ncbi:Crp/Fnr family transcriptional regulator [Xanthomonas bonasiae]|uniref:Crp/Fnr family transcriptional regulator n=1 Tax=Xanthomonas bonasiae TaxID=2810351 RepID=UPI0017844EFC|nr:Crp/Fnr family transcriptional regulator [Xanthomonas surreyensis]MBD7920893.1 Crp/Fnr family transcriptional regulator [Xanthomonas surreyensis]
MDFPAVATLEASDIVAAAHVGNDLQTPAAHTGHRTLLERSMLFHDLPAALLDHLLAHASECDLAPGSVLFFKHDPSSFVGVVVRGRLYKVLYGADGQELIVGTIEPGGLVDEAALLEPHGRSFTAIAFGASTVLKLSRRHFAPLMESPLLQQRIEALLRVRLRQALDSLESMCLHRLEVRLARYVLRQLEVQEWQRGGSCAIVLPPNQSILAAMLNVSRSKLNAQLQQWKRNGLVSRRRNLLRIHDLDALCAKAYLHANAPLRTLAWHGEDGLRPAPCLPLLPCSSG